MRPTKYHGYKSYQYLTPGRDYKEYELCAEVDRVPSPPVAVSESEARRVDELLARGPIISLHDHPSVMPLRIESELVRAIGLTYNSANHVGSGLGEPVDGGLTSFGRRVVERMNQLGILIDLAHVGDRTSLDAIRESKTPVCISHAGARALWPTQRLKSDEVLAALADHGGVIGIEAAPNTTITRTHRRHSLDSIMEHFEYCVQLMGIDHVAFGPDTTFGDHVGFHKAVVDWFGPLPIATSEPFESVQWVDGVESPAESFPNIVRWLVKRGYSDDDISKALGGNVLRLLQATWDNPTGR